MSPELKRRIDVAVEAAERQARQEYAEWLRAELEATGATATQTPAQIPASSPATAINNDESKVNQFVGSRTPQADYQPFVVPQAVTNWRELFGSGVGANPNDVADDQQIIKRIIGVYYNGTLEGKGMRWVIKGFYTHGFAGVLLQMVLQGNTMHIVKVEKVDLTSL